MGVTLVAFDDETPEGRLTTRVVPRVVVGAVRSGQHGTVPLPGWRSAGYAPGQKNGEILHNVDI